MKKIDTRGLECPKPVIKTKEAVDSGCSELCVIVDNEIAVSNVTRFLEGQGFAVTREDKEWIELVGKRTQAADKKANGSRYAVLFTSNKLGAESGGLGEVLMKAYVGTLAEKEEPPVAVALMNDGVKMALEESSVMDTLGKLEAKGTSVLVCGTCTKHFGITDMVRVGVISNMFEITEAVFSADKYIVIG
ncbi:MAG: sulfurtransferase-like selenium metabolism protein YedF [Synergistaceae bacterium]|nr:sulfurtransferase-like selenium metabolism protein YedF [Synergistaceae bacterium]